jgi:hypothetical protein
MGSLLVTAIVLACLVGGALLGMGIRARLPGHHLSQESIDLIKLTTGLMATLAALVLGLLISSANTTHNQVESEYRQSVVNVVLLDRYLGQYGPQTQDARALLRHIYLRKLQTIWPEEDFGPKEPAEVDGEPAIEAEQHILLRLAPGNDAQTWYRARALEMVSQVQQLRWLLVSHQAVSAIPTPLLVVLVFWATAIFVSFGLLARPNPTLLFALFVCALAVACAIFMLFELDSPFTGLIKISSGPARAALAVLGQ